ncbi:carboxylic acid reductase [Nocardia vinacea]|uniref:carboxylic acid reductase n=1 Tax=Nocardia vinacea TaxID=96468 RepID=UPI0033E47B2E
MKLTNKQARLVRRVTELVEGDEQIRAALPLEQVGEAVQRAGTRLAENLATIMEGYADRPALGRHAVEFVADETGRRHARLLPRFDTITYGQLWQRVRALAAAWHHDPEKPSHAGDFVAIIGFTSIDYTTIDLACTCLGTVSVPLQAGAALAQLAPIVGETEPRVLAADIEQLSAAVELAVTAHSVRSLIVFDYHAEEDDHRAALDAARNRLANSPVVVEILDAVVDRGRDLPAAPLHTAGDENNLSLLIYTSGSTGTPKGAMYPESLVARMWRAGQGRPLPSIGLSYMPMSHMAGRGSLIGCLSVGGTVFFAARSDMSTLFEDIALVRPTMLLFVPRVCDIVLERFRSEVDRRSAAGQDLETAEREVKTELREHFLGGRFLSAVSGSAPLSPQMRRFMESVLEFGMFDRYAATETGIVLLNSRVQRPPIIDYKLVDVPSLGYCSTDKPYPRGELAIKSETLVPGYYKRPDLYAEMFDADGFYYTGDVMAEVGPDELVYVDRRTDVLKLSQGEFVAVSKLEVVYTGSALVRQIYIHGSSERAFLLAVIVPTTDAVAAYPNTTDLRAAIGESLQRVAKDAALNSYEIPRDFLLETEPFTMAGGLLSGIGKLLRPKLKERYGAECERRYEELAHEQQDELSALRSAATERSVLEIVERATKALVSCMSTDLSPDAHFADLGGDSLSALSLSNLLQEVLGVEVPVGVIVGPATNLRQLAGYIEDERDASGRRPTAVSVHGIGTEIRAADLTLDKFIDTAILAAAGDLSRATQPPSTVLLTGSNGYLGRFLCLEWLERLHDSGGTLFCVVRGTDAVAARARLDEVFDSGDPELLGRYEELAAGTLEVLAGDISEPNFGVGKRDWHRLAEMVDLIVHPAALVNHILPYHQLFGPNVVGTAEVIRLALTARLKPVMYLSTVRAAAQVNPEAFTEDGDIREASPVRSLDDSYANGYRSSKWAGEVLLREAHELCGLPVAVFRSDMILAHSRYAGQLNVLDMFTRLLLSVLATGVAPKSFYVTDSDGNRQRAHYDGLPADFTAAAITTLPSQVGAGYETFDVLNPHDDGLSLDVFVDWLIAAEHQIERIDDYAEWLSRFETALRALPMQQRQHSVLPLLHAYRHPDIPQLTPALPGKRFQGAVRQAKLADGEIPHLTPALIQKYVTDLKLRNLL